MGYDILSRWQAMLCRVSSQFNVYTIWLGMVQQ